MTKALCRKRAAVCLPLCAASRRDPSRGPHTLGAPVLVLASCERIETRDGHLHIYIGFCSSLSLSLNRTLRPRPLEQHFRYNSTKKRSNDEGQRRAEACRRSIVQLVARSRGFEREVKPQHGQQMTVSRAGARTRL